MQILGQIPTPEEYVNLMLDEVGYHKQLVGKTFIDNSCGDGNVLVEAVKRYIYASKEEGHNIEYIKKHLEYDIQGYDVDENAVKKSIERLNALAAKEGIYDVRWNIQTEDYLRTAPKKYDYIVGNPPYITYHDLTIEQRKYVKNTFVSCENGRFDYCYAFVEKSLESLATNGKMAYLIPFSIFRNKFADKLRKRLLEKLSKIVDLSGIKVFPDRTIGTAIVICEAKGDEKIEYVQSENKINTIEKASLNDRWIFGEQLTGGKKMGDYFNVLNSVATLKNEVYLFEPEREDDNYYYFKNEKIEKVIVYDAVSPRSKQANRNYKIIFPYKVKDKRIIRIEVEEFQRLYPFTYQYMLKNKDDLLSRSLVDMTYWYEYGRSQALSSVNVEKIIIPMVISNKIKVYQEGEHTIPFAGYYITCKTNKYTLKDAKQILEDPHFMEYVKKCGTPTTKTSYRVSTCDIKNYTF